MVRIIDGPGAQLDAEHQQRIIERCGPALVADGVDYRTMHGTYEIRSLGSGGIEIDFGMHRPINQCDCCGRADWVKDVAGSFEEAVARGWLIPVADR